MPKPEAVPAFAAIGGAVSAINSPRLSRILNSAAVSVLQLRISGISPVKIHLHCPLFEPLRRQTYPRFLLKETNNESPQVSRPFVHGSV